MLVYRGKNTCFRQRQGGDSWRRIDTAHVYFDHPYDAPLDHALSIDFHNHAAGSRERVAVELSAESARELANAILAALDRGAREHGETPHGELPASIAPEACFIIEVFSELLRRVIAGLDRLSKLNLGRFRAAPGCAGQARA